MNLLFEEASAVISPDGSYRYELRRQWAPGPITATFVMLNPSTADALTDDATVRRCTGFAKRENCSALVIVNLCAYRATDPADLRHAIDPCGPRNREHVHEVLAAAEVEQEAGFPSPVIVAWGAYPLALLPDHALDVVTAFPIPLMCLGTTASGAPKHPLYLAADTPLVEWTRP